MTQTPAELQLQRLELQSQTANAQLVQKELQELPEKQASFPQSTNNSVV
jgi:hypothetical protein